MQAVTTKLVNIVFVYTIAVLLCTSCDTVVVADSNGTDGGIMHCFDNNTEAVCLDNALAELGSHSTLHLCSGTHTLCNFTLIRDVVNISLHGTTGPDSTVITCLEAVGLAFFNVTHLQIENIDIIGCGTRGNATETVEALLKMTVGMFFRIPNETNVAVILGSCTHVHFSHVAISDSSGLGLVGVNVMGTSILHGVDFLNNTYIVCEDSDLIAGLRPGVVTRQGGGGAIFLYHDYLSMESYPSRDVELTITHSNFTGNKDCSPASLVELLQQYSTALQGVGYLTEGGGGLTVILAQTSYHVNATVTDTMFEQNRARYGSGAHIGIFNSATNFLIRFVRCYFAENGKRETVYFPGESRPVAGAGIAILNDLINPLNPRPVIDRKNGFVVIEDSDFIQNDAFKGSGLYVYSLHSAAGISVNSTDSTHTLCINCTFEHNIGAVGPAIYAREHKLKSGPLGIVLHLENVSVIRNTVAPLDKSFFRLLLKSSAAVHVRSVNVFFGGQCFVEHTDGTGVHGRHSTFTILRYSMVTIANNHGEFGGGMTLLFSTYIYPQPNSTLRLLNNTGSVKGGALYVRLRDDVTFAYSDCFLYFVKIDALTCDPEYGCDELKDLGISIEFLGNDAPVGSTMYGSSLETCAWVKQLKEQVGNDTNESTLDFLSHHLSHVFNFDHAQNEIKQFSSEPAELTLSGVVGSIMPGQSMNISVCAIDQWSQPTSTIITSTVLTGNNARTEIGTSGYLLIGNTTTIVPLRVMGHRHDKVKVELYSIESYADEQFTVMLDDCSPGFEYSEDTLSCDCKPEIKDMDIDCDIERAVLLIPDNLWIGPVDADNDTVDLVGKCVLDYCQPGEKTIAPRESKSFDAQCNEGYGRTGILCGKCKANLSLVFGTSRCLKCTNEYLTLLIAFVVAGIVLTLGISLLHITVTRGYLNAILLYCNVIGVYTSYFATVDSKPSLVLISLLNLNLGIEVCFFDGMDSLMRASLQLVFPAYLFLLMGLMILLARTRPFQWLAHPQLDAVKAFGTLLLLCYNSVLESCIEILGVVYIRTMSGEHQARWLMDPTIHYFHSWHALEGAIAVVLLIFYVSLFPLLLMVPSLAYRLPYVKKLKPLFDALYSPLTNKTRWWLGVRLIARTPPFVFVFFVKFPSNLFLLAPYLAALLYVQLMIRPFKSTWVNAVDNLLITNAILLILSSLSYHFDPSSQRLSTILFHLLVYFSYGIFAMILTYYIFTRLSQQSSGIRNGWNRLRQCAKRLNRRSDYEKLSNEPPSPAPNNLTLATHTSVRVTHHSGVRPDADSEIRVTTT